MVTLLFVAERFAKGRFVYSIHIIMVKSVGT